MSVSSFHLAPKLLPHSHIDNSSWVQTTPSLTAQFTIHLSMNFFASEISLIKHILDLEKLRSGLLRSMEQAGVSVAA
jgi:hypothetical protein